MLYESQLGIDFPADGGHSRGREEIFLESTTIFLDRRVGGGNIGSEGPPGRAAPADLTVAAEGNIVA